MKALTVVTAALVLVGVSVWAQMMSDEDTVTQLFQEVSEAVYTNWAFQPGVPEGYYVGQQPHGLVLRSYANDIALEGVGSGADAFPEGSIIVKENHMPGDVDTASMEPQAPVAEFKGQLDAITYMVKMPGYNPDAGDWFWAKIQPGGAIDVAGKGAGCIGCHTQVAENDYVFNSSLK